MTQDTDSKSENKFQMLFKNKLLGSFAVFGIYYVGTQILSTAIALPIFIAAQSAEDAGLSEALFHAILIAYAVYYLALFFAGIFVSNHIFKKKLNLA